MRNHFLILLCLIFQTACTHGSKAVSPSNLDDSSLPIIDVHTHTDFSNEVDESSGLSYTLEGYLESMKKAHVVGAVSHSPRDGSNMVQDLSKYNVIRCLGIGFEVNAVKVETSLSSRRFQCLKIYLGYVYRYPNDVQYKRLYRLAEKYNVPVVFHTGDTYSTKGKLKYSDPLGIDEVAVEFPKVRFVIAHLGNPWIQSAAEVAYKNPNVYIEASALLIGKLDQEPSEKLAEYVVKPIRWAFGYLENPSKLMFGTDWPLSDMQPYVELYKKSIPKENWCDVFYNNAIKVFNLKKEHECKI